MSSQIQITGETKVKSLTGVLTGTSGVVNALAINVPNGIPQLDGSGKILVSQLPNSVMEYKGTWDASTNTPTLVNGTGNQGDVYLCNVAGTVNFGAGPITFFVGDQVIYSGTIWQRASGASGTVTSVAVTESGDSLNITGSPITTSGTINIGFNGTNLQYINGAGDLTTFPSLTGYVPYSGATGNVNLGEFGLTGGYLGFDTTPTSTPTAQGTMYWNADKESVDVIMNGVTGSVMQDNFYNVKNQTGSTITKGTVVRANGTVGASGRILIAPFLADGSYDSKICLGVTAETILNGEDGKVTAFGAIRQIDTSAFANGTILYASPSTAGGFTSTEPTNPNNIVTLAIVVYSDVNNGEIFVRPTFVDNAADIASSLGYTPANSALVVPYTGATASVDLGAYVLGGSELYSNGLGSVAGFIYLKQNTLISQYLADYSSIGAYSNGYVFNIATPSVSKQAKLDLSLISASSSRTFTLPDASGTIALTSNLSSYVPYTGATADVNLGTFSITGGIGTFTNGVLNGNGSNPANLYLKKGSAPFFTNAANYGLIAAVSSSFILISDVDGTNYKYASFNLGSLTNNTNRAYTLPDASGTLALLSADQTFTGINSFDYGINYKTGASLANVSGYISQAYAKSGTGAGSTLSLKISDGNSVKAINLDFVGSPATYTYTFPDFSGTVALTSQLGSYLPLAGGIMTGSLLLNNNIPISGQLFGTSSYASMLAMSPSDKVVIDNSGRGVIFGGTIGQGAYTYTFPAATGTLPLGTGTTNYHAKWTGTNTIGNSLIWDNGTNVGIGNTNTSYTLDVSGTLRSTTSAYFATTSGGVGIGTTSANSLLTVRGASTTDYGSINAFDTRTAAIDQGPSIAFGGFITGTSSGGTFGLIGAKKENGTAGNEAGYISFNPNNGSGVYPERMRITSAGYINIGNNIAQLLPISTTNFQILNGYIYDGTNLIATATTGSRLIISGGTFQFSTFSGATIGSSVTDTERMRITSGGVALFGGTTFTTIASSVLGATNPSQTGRNWSFGPNSSGDFVVYHNSGSPNFGVYLSYGSTSWTSNSDENIKDIIEIIPNAVDSIKDLRAVKFYWKGDKSKIENIGLIAQDVEKVYPQIISKQEIDGKEILGVKYQELIPVLVKAIQELSAQNQDLKSRLDKAGL